MKACEGCGKPVEKAKARFCSDACRKRVSRKVEVEPSQVPTGVVRTVKRDLEKARTIDTPLGQMTLQLAERLENSTFDTASAIAALAKELRLTLEAALAQQVRADDPMDELRARRERRHAG